MSNPSPAPGETPRLAPRRGVDWLVLTLGGIMALAIGVNGVMLWVAERNPPQLVDRATAVTALDLPSTGGATPAPGWRVLPQAGTSGAVLTLRVEDAQGQPLTGLKGQARAARAGQPGMDQALTWEEDAAQPGQYRARFATPAPGPWVILLRLSGAGGSVERTLEWTAP